MINKVFNILVVDDEEDYRETLKYLFESEGYMAKTAASAEEALTMLRSWDIKALSPLHQATTVQQ